MPINGSTALQGTMQTSSNGTNNALQCQPQTYGDIGSCSMECKTISNINMTTNLTTFISDDFKDANCTLIFQPSNITINTSYSIPIPSFNNLIYFSNSSTIATQLSCDSNIFSTSNTSLICRFVYRQQSYNNTSCPSTTITSRYIPPGLFCVTCNKYKSLFCLGCVDTIDWLNGRSFISNRSWFYLF